jgi:REP element-mobilizing transposase RayT
MARGNGRMRIFEDDGEYRYFVALFGDVTHEFKIDCLNYCLMPNHYHLTLQPTLPNLSNAMRHLNSVYAQWWNRRHDRVGHVFQGRFKDQIVQGEGYFLKLCRYIARNPERAKLTARPEEWCWSSYPATIGLRPLPAFLNVLPILRQFGGDDDAELRARFRAYVESDPDEEVEDRIRSTERVVGDQLFKAALRSGSDHAPTPV